MLLKGLCCCCEKKQTQNKMIIFSEGLLQILSSINSWFACTKLTHWLYNGWSLLSICSVLFTGWSYTSGHSFCICPDLLTGHLHGFPLIIHPPHSAFPCHFHNTFTTTTIYTPHIWLGCLVFVCLLFVFKWICWGKPLECFNALKLCNPLFMFWYLYESLLKNNGNLETF